MATSNNFCYSIILACWLLGTYDLFAQPEIQKSKQCKINDELYFNQLAERVYMITHYFPYYGGNSLLVLLNNKEAVLIDTPHEGVATTALLAWINNEFGDLELHAIVTGFHQDNLGGNEVLIQNGIPVYGMQLTANLVNSEGNDFKKAIMESVRDNENKTYFERYQKLRLTPPDVTFKLGKNESKINELGTVMFEFYYPGETHTVDNAVVYIHGEKMLFGGCMIRALSDMRPGYIKYANMMEWPVSVEGVAQRFPDAEIVIPGHGFEGDINLLPHTVMILKAWNEKHK